jgi:DNA-binding response OmpR family regulator
MSTTIDGPYRVLVIDDEALLREAFRAFLQKNGYFTAIAGSVAHANALLDEFMPHAVVVDGNLPDGHGLQFAAEIRKSPKYRAIKIIAMAGDAAEVRLAEMLKSQYDLILRKPFPMKDLLESLGRLLPKKDFAGTE